MGVGYHHSGLDRDDRNLLEQAFASGQIKCLACTSTLAQGVNTPAGLVVIVGTKAFRGNGREEVEISQLLQMIGRAGRPGLDESGTAVILTDKDSQHSVQRALNSGFGAAKSKLISHLPEAMNSAIANRVVGSLEDSLNWFQTTFLFCCMNRAAQTNTLSKAAKLCQEAVDRLKRIGLIRLNQEYIDRQPGCHVMNKHMLSLQAMSAISSWSAKVTECQILRSLSTLETIQFPVRRDQRKELREIHKTAVIKYKCVEKQLSKFTVKDESQKAFILLQAIISQHEFKDKLLKQQMSSVTNSATAILSAAQEYCFKATKFSTVAKICFQLHRSLMVCLWDIDGGALNQIDGVGLTSVRMLRFQGIHSFQHVLDASEEKIEKAAGRSFPFGRDLKQTVQGIMRDNLKLSAKIEYTRDSNMPAGLVLALKDPADARAAMMPREKDSSISFTLIASVDNPHGSIIMVKENVMAPSSFRVSLPPGVKKVAVTKLASMVGFDETVNLGTETDAAAEEEEIMARKAPNRRSFPRSEATNRPSQTRKRKTRQLEISFGSQKKTKSNHTSSQLDPSPTITPPRNENDRSSSDRIGTFDDGQDVRNGRNSDEGRHFPSNSLGSSRFAAAVRQHHSSAFQPSNVTPQVPRLDPRMTNTSGARMDQRRNNIPTQITTRHYPPRNEQPHVEEISKFWSSQRDNTNVAEETPSMKDSSREWRKSQHKASQSQKRAYTHKKENPFSHFRHDPNASELVLARLSKKSSSRPFKRTRDSRRDHQRKSRVDMRDMMHGYAEELEVERKQRYAPSHTPPNDYAFHEHQQPHRYNRTYPPGPSHSPPPPSVGAPYAGQYSQASVDAPNYGHSHSMEFSDHQRAPSRGGWESVRGGNEQPMMRQPPTPPPAFQTSYGGPGYSNQSAFADTGHEAYGPPRSQKSSYAHSQYGDQSFAGDIPYQGGYEGYERTLYRSNQAPPEIAFPAAPPNHQADHYSYQSDGIQNAPAQHGNPSQFQPAYYDRFGSDIF